MFSGSDLDIMVKRFIRFLLFIAVCCFAAGAGITYFLTWIF